MRDGYNAARGSICNAGMYVPRAGLALHYGEYARLHFILIHAQHDLIVRGGLVDGIAGNDECDGRIMRLGIERRGYYSSRGKIISAYAGGKVGVDGEVTCAFDAAEEHDAAHQ